MVVWPFTVEFPAARCDRGLQADCPVCGRSDQWATSQLHPAALRGNL